LGCEHRAHSKIIKQHQGATMKIKKQSKKPAKKEPVKSLPVVPLNEHDMSSVSGGSYNAWAG
jgi:hypothetical protein